MGEIIRNVTFGILSLKTGQSLWKNTHGVSHCRSILIVVEICKGRYRCG